MSPDQPEIDRLKAELAAVRACFAEASQDNVIASARIAELEEAIAPFALYASVFEGRDDHMTPVHQSGVQTITIGSFQYAREVLGPRKSTPDAP